MQIHATWDSVLKALTLFASGFTARELLSFISKKIHVWRQRQIDAKVIRYLVEQVKSCPPVGPDSYGHFSMPYYRSSHQIADALKRKSVDIIQRLERLEIENRVKRLAPKSDQWTVTEYELHDKRVIINAILPSHGDETQTRHAR